ncbi:MULTISPECIES: alpha/beta hydrolase [Prauserella salsuginis group]|uniref:Alpha/beta hydrolase n=1 Tax=Prauserella salsuginis TaxID=387889 RepID=A0ABW6G9B3_9PSEU|nr:MULTISPECIES: alpha/beta hydrolase [Prauserella salsuginis group]MCR3719437.1 Lysophospholipase, alpha-beta hydrolase superfamily [Prauserella flava]MCR3735549.1 Lysophospholipase, alpha-beta hydrolase superfamily [Prauserella salsuginis]
MHEAYRRFLPSELRAEPPPRRESTWWRWRGADVHVERVGDPDAPVRAVAFHGAGGHAALMWPYAALAARRGVHVVVPDLPGYGDTRVPDRSAVRYADWIEVACALTSAERETHDGPLWLIGASMGGMVAYEAATRTCGVDRLIATCLLDPRDAEARRAAARHPWLGAAAGPLLRVSAGPLAGAAVPLRWLTNMRGIANDPELVDVVLADRRGGGNRMPLGFFRSFFESAPAVEPEVATGPHVVLAHPADDRWTPAALSLRFFDRIAASKEYVPLEAAGHFPVESPGAERLAELLTPH